jgi:hypothetical protein
LSAKAAAGLHILDVFYFLSLLLCLRLRSDMSAIARKNIINRQQNKAPQRRDEGHYKADAKQENGVFSHLS